MVALSANTTASAASSSSSSSAAAGAGAAGVSFTAYIYRVYLLEFGRMCKNLGQKVGQM